MLFREKGFQAQVTYVLLCTLGWLTAGGPAWAEQLLAERAPQAFLSRMAENRRLNLDPADREALRDAARRPDAARLLASLAEGQAAASPARPGAAAAPAPCCTESGEGAATVPRPARSMAELAVELGRFTGDDAALARARTEEPEALRAAADQALERFEVAHRQVLAELAATERALRRAGLPAEVLDRHEVEVADYRERARAVRRDLRAASNGGDREALARAVALLATSTEERAHRRYDPSRPPYAVADPTWRLPGQAPGEAPVRTTEGPLVRRAAEVAPIAAAPAPSHTPPLPADLAETPEVVFTPEIQALAQSLGGDPLAIYDWVRNTIGFYPTWGSVQGAQRTLDMGRGNAFDVSSLLIALLRAAGVPARYVTGTIEVPADQVRNWVGGAATTEVAQQLLGQGGIANVGLIDGSGTLYAIRLDHVWVEVWADNVPSRGAVHREGDTWLPLDAAFKQHVFHQPSEVFSAVPFDSVLDPTDPPFAVDETLGRITDVDPDQFDAALAAWVQSADDYIVANGVEQSFEGVLGGAEIVPATSTVFAGSLPYRVVEREAPVAALAAGQRHAVRLRGYLSEFDRAFGSPAFDLRISLPELDARRLSLRFPPATQADADVLEAARTGGATSLPVYLVDVVPVIELDGVEVARGGSIGMGHDFFLDVVLEEPGTAATVPYRVTAGDEVAIGVTGNGVSPEVAEKRFAAYPVDNAPEYLHQVQLHYWAETDALGEVAAARRGVHPLRLPSVGLFSSTLSVSYLFGSPRTAVYAGRVMDVQRSFVGAAGADPDQVVGWVKHSGAQGSYLEGSVFEQLEVAATGVAQPGGISSIHLIAAAATQGVPIYRITPANAAVAQPLLALPAAVERDIADALAAGQTVLAPERAIDLGPWTGVGYILQDETTGAGAYLISGGLAGGGILDCLRELVPVFRFVLLFLLVLAILALIIWLILSAPVWVPAGAAAAAAFLFFLLVWRGMGPTSAPPMTA